MTALLLYDDWPQRHEGPGDVGESEGLGGLMNHVRKDHATIEEEDGGEENEDHADRRHALSPDGPRHEFPELVELDALVEDIKKRQSEGMLTGYEDWEHDRVQAEHIFLETPEELPSWLDRMRIKRLSKSEKHPRVVDLAERLVKEAIIAVPPQTWGVDLSFAQDPEHVPTKEEQLVFRLGFVFLAYRVDVWWWESVEVSPLPGRKHVSGAVRCALTAMPLSACA